MRDRLFSLIKNSFLNTFGVKKKALYIYNQYRFKEQ